MIKNSKFYINNLKTVVFIGYTDNFSELIKLNKSLKINTLIITSASQSKYLDKKIRFKIFNRIDQTFKNYINEVNKRTIFRNRKTLFNIYWGYLNYERHR